MIREYALIRPGQRIGVAVSGGRDSMALLYVLNELREELGCSLTCLHMEHGIRGEESRKDAEFVEEYAKKMHLPCIVAGEDVLEYAKQKRLNLEQAAREKRYAFLERQIKEGVVDRIALAHHLDDQAETVLLHLLRGSGLKGLGGMKLFRAPGIIRPFLEIGREEIDGYVEKHRIPYREDETNQDTEYSRNYLRHEIMPKLLKINGNARHNIARSATLLAEDYLFLEQQIALAKERCFESRKTEVQLDLIQYRREPRPVRRHLLRSVLEQDFALLDIEKKHIELLDQFAFQGNTGKRIDIKYEVFATISYGQLIISKKTAKIEDDLAEIPCEQGKTLLPGGGIFTCEPDKKPAQFPENSAKEQWAARQALEGAVIRRRRPGDRFQPFGMSGKKKLKDVMIDKKIPADQRNKIWLLAAGDQILWIPGYGMSELLRIKEETKQIMKISMIEGETK